MGFAAAMLVTAAMLRRRWAVLHPISMSIMLSIARG
jgi:hypothetical protein